MTDNFTKKVRKVALALFALVVVVALIGWLAGRDPSLLTGVLLAVTGAVGLGEASNVGKRATTKAGV